MTILIPNYPKMAQLWIKDRVKGDHAKTAKEKRDYVILFYFGKTHY